MNTQHTTPRAAPAKSRPGCTINAATDGDWKACAWKLERRYPAAYGRVTASPDERSEVSELLKAVLLELAERSQARDVTPEADWAPVPPGARRTNGVRPGLPAPPDVEEEAG